MIAPNYSICSKEIALAFYITLVYKYITIATYHFVIDDGHSMFGHSILGKSFFKFPDDFSLFITFSTKFALNNLDSFAGLELSVCFAKLVLDFSTQITKC